MRHNCLIWATFFFFLNCRQILAHNTPHRQKQSWHVECNRFNTTICLYKSLNVEMKIFLEFFRRTWFKKVFFPPNQVKLTLTWPDNESSVSVESHLPPVCLSHALLWICPLWKNQRKTKDSRLKFEPRNPEIKHYNVLRFWNVRRGRKQSLIITAKSSRPCSSSDTILKSIFVIFWQKRTNLTVSPKESINVQKAIY